MIDIRSDTVTGPTQAMRDAMAVAEVGDDVYGDDPTVNRLQELAARTLGKEAALFVPTGTFGNQLALFVWCERGSEVILGENSHIVVHEAGAAAVIAGIQTRCVPDPTGVPNPDDIAKRIRLRDLHSPATSLICLENAHSLGSVIPLDVMDRVRAVADERKLPVHMDGARIFNAAAALGCSAADIAKRVDSVMFCISKGLCSPAGSLLVGTKDFIEKARMKRKIMGGGMRQIGILAAAGIVALEAQVPLLSDDHATAKKLALGLSQIAGVKIVGGRDINMVFFTHPASGNADSSAKIVGYFRERGILINPPEEGAFRFVTHHWIGDSQAEKILEVSRAAFA